MKIADKQLGWSLGVPLTAAVIAFASLLVAVSRQVPNECLPSPAGLEANIYDNIGVILSASVALLMGAIAIKAPKAAATAGRSIAVGAVVLSLVAILVVLSGPFLAGPSIDLAALTEDEAFLYFRQIGCFA